jgi:hypothetical protein
MVEQERALYQQLLATLVAQAPPQVRLVVSSLGISTILNGLTDAQVKAIGDAVCELADRLRALRAAAAGGDRARPH